MNFDIFVTILVPSRHGSTQTAHRSLFTMNEDLKVPQVFTKLVSWMSGITTHNMLRLNLFDKLRILRIINMGAEGDIIHGNFPRY